MAGAASFSPRDAAPKTALPREAGLDRGTRLGDELQYPLNTRNELTLPNDLLLRD